MKKEGKCGTCSYTFDEDGRLTVSPDADRKRGYISPYRRNWKVTWPWTQFRKDVKEVRIARGVHALSLDSIFFGMEACRKFEVSALDTSEAVSASSAFKGCALFDDEASKEIADWDFGQLEDASYMFEGCTMLKEPRFWKWSFRKLKNACSMFEGSGLKNTHFVSDWSMDRAVNIDSMFYGCRSLEDIGGIEDWELEDLLSADYLFGECPNIEKIDPFLEHLLKRDFGTAGVFKGTVFEDISFDDLALAQNDDYEFLEHLSTGAGISAMELLHGYCNVFAKAVHEEMGFDLMQVMEGDALVHCYGVDRRGKSPVYVDVRGRFTDYAAFMAEFEDFVDIEEAPGKTRPAVPEKIDVSSRDDLAAAYRLSRRMLRFFRNQYEGEKNE